MIDGFRFMNLGKGKCVFKYGEFGDKFYIVLEGSVSVHIPVIKDILEENTT